MITNSTHITKLFTPLTAISILLPLIVQVMFASPVYAANLLLDQNSGAVGSTVTIKGDSFSGRFATIYWDDQIIDKDVIISQDGKLEYLLTIPTADKGLHIINIVDDSNWTSSSASINYDVLPKIKIFPSSGKEWTQVTITGSGFNSLEKDIKITWDGNVSQGVSTAADKLGSWSTIFTIPSCTKGDHYIGAFGSMTTNEEIDELLFIVSPWVRIQPISGPVGTQIIIHGWGFRVNEDGITVTWDDKIIIVNIRAESDGTLIVDGSRRTSSALHDGDIRESIYIPASTQGQHVIGVYGSSFTPKGVLPDTVFEVIPKVELHPKSGNKGDEIGIIGTGFGEMENIIIYFGYTRIDKIITADDTGSFDVLFEVPQSETKKVKVIASGNTGNSAQTNFTFEKISSPAPKLLAPVHKVKLSIFNSVGDVFKGTARYLFGVVDYLKGAELEVFNPSQTTFIWSDVNGSDNLSYVLQVALNNDFASPILDIKIDNDSEYTLSGGNVLIRGCYNWKVKSIDHIGNESQWSEVFDLEIISMPNIVVIFTIVILILILAAIILGILTIRANMSYR